MYSNWQHRNTSFSILVNEFLGRNSYRDQYKKQETHFSSLECLRKRILVGKFLPEKKTETENGPGFDMTKIMLRKFIFVVFLSYSGHH